MLRPLLMSGLLVLVAVAGCFESKDETPPSSSSATSGAPEPESSYRVTIRNYTSEGLPGQPVNVTWEVAAKVEGNATNQSVTVRHTSVHWGNKSVSSPYTGPEPGGTVPTSPTSSLTTTPSTPTNTFAAAALTTSSTSGGPVAPQGPQDYPNETKEQSGPFGLFNESFRVNNSGLVYLRAHAIVGNRSYWSDEVVVNVTSNATLPLGKQHVVEIGKTTPGPVADYSPKALNVKVGDSVVWKNIDGLSLGHTASSSAGNPSFDTGTIAKGATSKPVFFNATGTWTYRCNVHPNTMNGATVVVT